MNYRDKIRKAIECPQFGSARYGEWGMLNLGQRKNIKRLLDELDSADAYVVKIYKEKQELINYLKEQINDCPLTGNNENDMFYMGKMRGYQEILSKIEKSDK